MKEKNKEICQKIREIRSSLKLTQSQFAEICNLSEDSIGKIERGVTVPTIETLYKIAKSLKKPVETFLPSHKEKCCNDVSDELTSLVNYLRLYTAEDIKFIHELAVKIFKRRK
ncbi:MAG: helix-turn-helix transcriptional regulator [Nitrospirae bacterium]|nr:helix-turn-helix transcriptional regulator [Nitrospirota bacterium]